MARRLSFTMPSIGEEMLKIEKSIKQKASISSNFQTNGEAETGLCRELIDS